MIDIPQFMKANKVISKVKYNLYSSFDTIIDKHFRKTVVHHLSI